MGLAFLFEKAGREVMKPRQGRKDIPVNAVPRESSKIVRPAINQGCVQITIWSDFKMYVPPRGHLGAPAGKNSRLLITSSRVLGNLPFSELYNSTAECSNSRLELHCVCLSRVALCDNRGTEIAAIVTSTSETINNSAKVIFFVLVSYIFYPCQKHVFLSLSSYFGPFQAGLNRTGFSTASKSPNIIGLLETLKPVLDVPLSFRKVHN
jgi:hypothetical protein